MLALAYGKQRWYFKTNKTPNQKLNGAIPNITFFSLFVPDNDAS